MSDVRKALEAAAETLWATEGIDIDFNSPLMDNDRNEYRTHAARIVLAFLRAMPDWESVTGPATDPIEIPICYRLALLINDIEKETP